MTPVVARSRGGELGDARVQHGFEHARVRLREVGQRPAHPLGQHGIGVPDHDLAPLGEGGDRRTLVRRQRAPVDAVQHQRVVLRERLGGEVALAERAEGAT